MEDVARLAGVGIATVDRVMNERDGVSKTSRERVLKAARELGLRRILPASHHRNIRIQILLPRPDLPLIARMNEEFLHMSRRLDKSVVLLRKTLPDDSPRTLAKALAGCKTDAVIVYAADDPLVNREVEALLTRGVKVVTMISDLPRTARTAYAGMDHYRAGRAAGSLMRRMVAEGAAIVVLCNHLGIQSHAERLKGFREYLAEHAPSVVVARVLEGGDDRLRSDSVLQNEFSRGARIDGIYNVGAANLGVAAALGRGSGAKPVFIGHELTPTSAELLRSGIMDVAIDQAPELQARFAVDVLLAELGYVNWDALQPPYRSPVPVALYTSENIPDDFD